MKLVKIAKSISYIPENGGLLWQASGLKAMPKTTRSYPRLAAPWKCDGNAGVWLNFRLSFISPARGEPTALHFWFLDILELWYLRGAPIRSNSQFGQVSPEIPTCIFSIILLPALSLGRITKICLRQAPTTPQGTHWTPCLWAVLACPCGTCGRAQPVIGPYRLSWSRSFNWLVILTQKWLQVKRLHIPPTSVGIHPKFPSWPNLLASSFWPLSISVKRYTTWESNGTPLV